MRLHSSFRIDRCDGGMIELLVVFEMVVLLHPRGGNVVLRACLRELYFLGTARVRGPGGVDISVGTSKLCLCSGIPAGYFRSVNLDCLGCIHVCHENLLYFRTFVFYFASSSVLTP